ncbi:uncharacterized protein K452DRAFT_345020 [Aplosporella prunicola CBS 121167]|uniref:Uncharacterized protein n=1 Tax=Aplosporella prunicola CBS 121167 TaxID=1176127 RepID=A0A6A6AWI2_9PEZI|nr:uncharacterized protein K452DRAFT_345020 [Aplosporella prunicola CBS 121167]KAF2136080.1 hypothetical protein K452DRAFT_345020 [Aplosporella prunicola CBS 121167]
MESPQTYVLPKVDPERNPAPALASIEEKARNNRRRSLRNYHGNRNRWLEPTANKKPERIGDETSESDEEPQSTYTSKESEGLFKGRYGHLTEKQKKACEELLAIMKRTPFIDLDRPTSLRYNKLLYESTIIRNSSVGVMKFYKTYKAAIIIVEKCKILDRTDKMRKFFKEVERITLEKYRKTPFIAFYQDIVVPKETNDETIDEKADRLSRVYVTGMKNIKEARAVVYNPDLYKNPNNAEKLKEMMAPQKDWDLAERYVELWKEIINSKELVTDDVKFEINTLFGPLLTELRRCKDKIE